MQMAVEEAYKGVESGEGGPFGAVIVRDGQVVVRTHNKVLLQTDPTAHAEMLCLRRAALRLPRIAAPRCGLASVAPLNLQAWLDEHGPTLQPPVANKLLFGGDLKVMARRPAPRARDAKPTLPPTHRSSAGRTRAAITTCRRARSSSCNSRASSASR